MLSDSPTPPLCPDCREPMKFIKAIPHIGGLPEILVFYCSRCKQAETKVQEQTAAMPCCERRINKSTPSGTNRDCCTSQ
jgi:hypothetical protein